jgi:U3 small nucleolar RNA-associated protein 13
MDGVAIAVAETRVLQGLKSARRMEAGAGSSQSLKRLARTVGQLTAWKPVKSHVGAYTGGKVEVSRTGEYAACQYGADVAFLALGSGVVCHTVRRLAEASLVKELSPSEAFTSFALHPDGTSLVTASRNLLVRRWVLSAPPTSADAVEISCERSWKAVHRLPVVCMEFDGSGTLIATGSGDRSIMVYDVVRGYCTHNFRSSSTSGVVSAVRFAEVAGHGLRLFSCTDGDSTIRVWDLATSACVAQLDGHDGSVSDLAFSLCGRVLLSAGRDQVINFWDVGTSKLVHTQAAFEVLESICTTTAASAAKKTSAQNDGDDAVEFATGGSSGVVRVWRAELSTTTVEVAAAEPVARGSAKKRRKKQRQMEAAVAVPPPAPRVVVTSVSCRKVGGQLEPSAAQIEAKTMVPLTSVRLLPTRGRGARGVTPDAMEHDGKPSDSDFDDGESPAARMLSITQDQRFVFLAIERSTSSSGAERVRLTRERQVIGFNDEVIDLEYIPRTSALSPERIAMATNSERAAIVDVATFDTHFLEGHSDLVLAIAASPCGRYVATGAKDHTVRVWSLKDFTCVAVGVGHTAEVGALSMPHTVTSFSPNVPGRHCWLVSGSRDKSVKVWDLRRLGETKAATKGGKKKGGNTRKGAAAAAAPTLLRALPMASARAHTKDINALAVSPNDRMIATASQDKMIQLYAIVPEGDTISLAERGELRGHKRGVWAAAFSPTDKCLATASADKTVKLWSIDTRRCIRTFEGHTSSVLRVAFLPSGTQLVSSGADGLVKVWSVQSAECQTTLERHTDRVWALSVAPPAPALAAAPGAAPGAALDDAWKQPPLTMVTGGADSTLVIWRDVTAAEEEKTLGEQEALVLKEQELSNVLRAKDFKRAVWLAMDLDKPYRLKRIFRELVENGGASAAEEVVGAVGATDTLGEVILAAVKQPKRLAQLLRYVLDWNTRAVDMDVAQRILERILRHVAPHEVLACDRAEIGRATDAARGSAADKESGGCDLRQTLDALIAYSERHAERIERLQRSCALFDFTRLSMDKLASTAGGKL